MAKPTISVEGMPEVKAALDRLAPAIRAAVANAVRESAGDLETTMKRLVPVDTGALQRGIDTRQRDDINAEVGVFSGKLVYAQWVENGTSSKPAQPFMLPAAEVERRRLPERVARSVRKATGK